MVHISDQSSSQLYVVALQIFTIMHIFTPTGIKKAD